MQDFTVHPRDGKVVAQLSLEIMIDHRYPDTLEKRPSTCDVPQQRDI